jgi:hypothetical protein
VKLGLFMMPMHPPERPPADAYELDIETLVAADRLGYDEAWSASISPAAGRTFLRRT